MERTKYLFLIFFSLFSLILSGQNNKSIYQAYIDGDMVKWKETMDSLEVKEQKTSKEKLDLINYHYGYIAWCISQERTSEAKDYMDKSEEYIELLKKNNYNLSMLYAYKAAFVGFEIGISIYKAPFIGPRSLSFANQSVSYNSKNAMAYIQLGNIAFYTPKMFGGSKPEAMQHYLKAVKNMEADESQIDQNWNYLNLLATIISAYIELEQYSEAERYCIKTLAIEPDFNWIKNELYPQILKKL